MSIPHLGIPPLTLLPSPLPSTALQVGRLITKPAPSSPSSYLNPSRILIDQDYDDVGHRWYKDVVRVSSVPNKDTKKDGVVFEQSLGASLLIPEKDRPTKEGEELGTIESEEVIVRMLKDPTAALNKIFQNEEGKTWLQNIIKSGQNNDVYMITALRTVKAASYKRAALIPAGPQKGLWEVVRYVPEGEGEEEDIRHTGQGKGKKRRDSGLEVDTGSKWDVVGVEIRRVEMDGEGGGVRVGEVVGEEEGRGMF
ncbi:hypothetical protein GQ43DRAFT_442991 [Delitschia confertaspora ATCC 74209]|uniref:Uncharacterized protein n=1 Tax=Delitschia confertaspora ATCC 74209 TaxID=1513339 RepID=A0A9P4JG84_9PLEO|nr:hypothetical protein GQ43DRAFT_442991 [Delitschia confertaspora ATCC 74209]